VRERATRLFSGIERLWNTSKLVALMLVFVFIGLCLWAIFRPQSPGVSIGMLGLVAGIMSVRPKMHILEKIAWICILIVFAVLEVRAIRRGDEANREIQERQNQQFSAIADDLKASINNSASQYHSTISHIDGVLTRTEEVDTLAQRSLENITGGKSYVALIPDVAYSDDEITFSVVNRGTYMLTGASVLIATQGVFWPGVRGIFMDAVSKRLELPTLHPGERMVIDRRVELPPNRPEGDIQRIYVTIGGPNFSTEEYLEFKRAGKDQKNQDAWQYKYTIYRLLPYRLYKPGEKVSKDPILEQTDWTTENDPKYPVPKPK
jgi:uncharacterized membrane protein